MSDTKWLKYRHKSSAGRAGWTWKLVSADMTLEDAEDEVRYSYSDGHDTSSEHYRGFDYELVDAAPLRVIDNAHRAAVSQAQSAICHANQLSMLRAKSTVCPQCKDVAARPELIETVACPLCGLQTPAALMQFLPTTKENRAAIKLLGDLVRTGGRRRGSKMKGPRAAGGWPVSAREAPAHRQLSDLGLVMGVTAHNTVTITPTKRGIAEWERFHKNH